MTNHERLKTTLKEFGLAYEHTNFKVMDLISFHADGIKVHGGICGFVEFKFDKEGKFVSAGIYSRNTPDDVPPPPPPPAPRKVSAPPPIKKKATPPPPPVAKAKSVAEALDIGTSNDDLTNLFSKYRKDKQ